MPKNLSKREQIYGFRGCFGDPRYGFAYRNIGIGNTATCDKDGKRASSSGSTATTSYDDAYYCCSKDGCNSAGYAKAALGLSLLTITITAMKFC